MHWTEEVAQSLAAFPMPPKGLYGGGGRGGGGVHVINDSKTPSGRAHVGALRGVLIHDAMFRVLKQTGVEVRFRFGCDDYDPVDELPHGMKEHFAQYLGQPLCNTPAPPGSKATDMADHFITDFWSVFKDLGVTCEFYRMRDVYRQGLFNEAIDRILRSSDKVRAIYKEVSNAERPASWLPFQTICENCGRIGTTECSNYDGKTVEYVCRPDLVTWAKGCGHRGKVSPFDGRGKLPWKLEWVAKWVTFPVTIEGAGEDHNTKGGSRDVAAQCLKAIYAGEGREAPQNIPYGFVLVGGAKMSSSKGLGVAARQMADFLPPEILRFLMVRTKPKSQANFEPSEEALVKLFNEFDRAHQKSFPMGGAGPDPKFPDHERKNYLLSEVKWSVGPSATDAPTLATQDYLNMRSGWDSPKSEGSFFDCEFQLVLALVQMTHLDIYAEFDKIKLGSWGSTLNPIERAHLDKRIHAARHFIANLASPEERLTLQSAPPARTSELSPLQRGFLRTLADRLKACEWTGESIQGAVFDAARLTPIDQPSAFLAFYRVLLDNTKGPKAGNFLAFLKREDVVRLFEAVPFDEAEFLAASVSSIDDIRKFAQDGKSKAIHAVITTRSVDTHTFVEASITMDDDKRHTRRVQVAPGASPESVIKSLRDVLPKQIA